MTTPASLIPLRIENFLDWHTFLPSVIKTRSRPADPYRPFCKTQSLFVKGKSNIVSFVSSLNQAIDPTAILRRIRSIVIDAIDCHARSRYSHISYKSADIVPAFANLYSPATIIWKTFISWQIASIKHSAPYTINLCIAQIMRFPSRICRNVSSWFFVVSHSSNHNMI
jgi:hypothetical protein